MRGHSKLSAYRFDELDQFTEILDSVIEEKLCCSLEALAVNGKDLMAIGIPQGTEIGRIKQALLDEVIEETIPNEKEPLLKRAKELFTT
jgi:tRNA nucleotidyltransferase (CCA-adding enzyme)